MASRTAAAAALLLALSVSPVMAQDHVPQPYQPDEFAAWMHTIWRAEAVFVGSFPVSLFLTLEGYDIIRYLATGFKPSYAPWPFSSGSTVAYSSTETAWLAVSALTLSLVVAGIDFILGRIDEKPPQN